MRGFHAKVGCNTDFMQFLRLNNNNKAHSPTLQYKQQNKNNTSTPYIQSKPLFFFFLSPQSFILHLHNFSSFLHFCLSFRLSPICLSSFFSSFFTPFILPSHEYFFGFFFLLLFLLDCFHPARGASRFLARLRSTGGGVLQQRGSSGDGAPKRLLRKPTVVDGHFDLLSAVDQRQRVRRGNMEETPTKGNRQCFSTLNFLAISITEDREIATQSR